MNDNTENEIDKKEDTIEASEIKSETSKDDNNEEKNEVKEDNKEESLESKISVILGIPQYIGTQPDIITSNIFSVT